MHRFRQSRLGFFPMTCAAAFIVLAGLAVGCSSSDDNSPPAQAASFYGTYTDPAGPGTITLTQAAAAAAGASALGGGSNPVPLIGTLTLAGFGDIPVDGTYFIDTGVLTFSSLDDAYNFAGDVVGGIASGTSSGPDGGGAFVLFAGGTPFNVGVYCGSAVCTSPPFCKSAITFDMALAGSTALVTADLNGTLVNSIGSISGNSVDIHITQGGENVTIHGTLFGSSISGNWIDSGFGESGTFSGTSSACTAGSTARRR